MPINAWSKHGECLLVPVENEAEETPDPEPTDGEGEGNDEGV
jgi:hypothetical protein